MQKNRALPAVLFAVAVSALVGGEHVEDVESDRLVYSAISGMLQTLDPHSSFLDPRAYAQMRERQEGRYYGLGISISPIDGDITVMSLFEGSPAYKKGIRRGDVIARIEGQDTKGWTSDQAVKQLRGPDEVNIPTLKGVFMIGNETGYIRLNDFSETTDRDLGDALETLSGKGMKRLLLDIRDNPGGPLDQAIKVSDRFLPKGDMVVYTRGRTRNSDQDYRASEPGDFGAMPLHQPRDGGRRRDAARISEDDSLHRFSPHA